MSSDENLSIQGALAETTVPDLIRSIVRSSETAILSLDAIGRSDTLFFSEGRLVNAVSTDPDMGLAETLLRSGELNIQQYDHAMERLVVARRLGGLLCELGYLAPEDLTRAVERQASAIVLNAIAYRTGSYTIEFAPSLPDGIIPLPLMTERLILDGVRRLEYWSLITRGIGRLDRMLRQVPGADTRAFQLELNDDESHVLSLLAEDPQSIEQLCARSYLSNFQTLRTIWGLLAVNLVTEAETSGADEKRAAMETEYELEAMVEKYNTVFQRIFGLAFHAIGDHVYDFMDRVVLHLSPETLPYLSGMSFINEGRVDFDQLLNNLYASGSQNHGAVVHDVLNELLYGWIYETKAEFGPAMESEIVKLAESLRR
ncbi:MAG: DUF4388 domain-containing protein [Acidobacteria bacterium]|nr:DUF4388 domain-containing protein [Acidobacteriota bacterium]MBV9476150.1 DUF4388 domain-containing protein [Acidobacteriota bacterium]